jgi:hypothetical protein
MRRQNRPSRPFSRSTRRVKVSDAVFAAAAPRRRRVRAFFGKGEPIPEHRLQRRVLLPWVIAPTVSSPCARLLPAYRLAGSKTHGFPSPVPVPPVRPMQHIGGNSPLKLLCLDFSHSSVGRHWVPAELGKIVRGAALFMNLAYSVSLCKSPMGATLTGST